MKRYFFVSYWKDNATVDAKLVDVVMDSETLLDLISEDFNAFESVEPVELMIKGE